MIAHGIQDGVSPAGQAGFSLCQPDIHQPGEGLLPGGVG